MLTRTPEYRWQGLIKIFENLALMYGQHFKNFLKIIWTAAGMGPKSQNLFRLTIRPPKNSFFWTGQSGPKNNQFHPDWPSGLENGSHGPQTTVQQLTVCTEAQLNHSAPSHPHYSPHPMSLGLSCVPQQQPLWL
jgi:hypothetical protein